MSQASGPAAGGVIEAPPLRWVFDAADFDVVVRFGQHDRQRIADRARAQALVQRGIAGAALKMLPSATRGGGSGAGSVASKPAGGLPASAGDGQRAVAIARREAPGRLHQPGARRLRARSQ